MSSITKDERELEVIKLWKELNITSVEFHFDCGGDSMGSTEFTVMTDKGTIDAPEIVDYFEDGNSKSVRIKYVWEEDALGTAGALGLVDGFIHEHILMMNSDLLTNINFEDFYIFMEEVEADFAVACIPYQVNVPYAVMETIDNKVVGFKEKPTYTHYSNAGIYLMKREVINLVPKHKHFNATDLMEILIAKGKKVVSYPLVGYWLDIGKHEDYNKAQLDFAHVKF